MHQDGPEDTITHTAPKPSGEIESWHEEWRSFKQRHDIASVAYHEEGVEDGQPPGCPAGDDGFAAAETGQATWPAPARPDARTKPPESKQDIAIWRELANQVARENLKVYFRKRLKHAAIRALSTAAFLAAIVSAVVAASCCPV